MSGEGIAARVFRTIGTLTHFWSGSLQGVRILPSTVRSDKTALNRFLPVVHVVDLKIPDRAAYDEARTSADRDVPSPDRAGTIRRFFGLTA
jgi:hypothetical protein